MIDSAYFQRGVLGRKSRTDGSVKGRYAIQQGYDLDRLYETRKDGTRRLASIEDSMDGKIQGV